MTSSQFGKRVKAHVLKSIEEFCKMSNKEKKYLRAVNESKIPAISEHLVYNSDCASSYNLKEFKFFKIKLAFLI